MSRAPSFTPRDIRLMVGFALFVEVVLGYMLLIDGPLGQLQRLHAQLEKSQVAHATLKDAVQAQQKGTREKLPPALMLQNGENSSLAIQSYLDRLTSRHAVTPLGTSILADEAPTCRVEAEVQGSYEAIGSLIAELERPSILMGVDGLDLRTDPQDPDRIRARMTLTFFYREP